MIVAEMSANHNGKKETAIETVRAAKRAGADAVKLQTYRADTITLRCDKPDFIINEGSIWDGQYFYDLRDRKRCGYFRPPCSPIHKGAP